MAFGQHINRDEMILYIGYMRGLPSFRMERRLPPQTLVHSVPMGCLKCDLTIYLSTRNFRFLFGIMKASDRDPFGAILNFSLLTLPSPKLINFPKLQTG